MLFSEKTVNKNYIYKGKILSLRCDDAELCDGKIVKREIVEHSGGSCVLCVNDGKILFVRQYRYAYGTDLLEIPAGKINSGEPPDLTAVRELEEECGIKAKKVEKLFAIYPSPGYTNEIIYIYKAEDFSQGEIHLDEGEFVSSEWIDEKTVKTMLDDGRIHDAKTVIALQYYFLHR